MRPCLSHASASASVSVPAVPVTVSRQLAGLHTKHHEPMTARFHKQFFEFGDSLIHGDIRFVVIGGEEADNSSFAVLSSLSMLRVNAQFFARESATLRNTAEVDLKQLCMDQRFTPTEASLKLTLAFVFGLGNSCLESKSISQVSSSLSARLGRELVTPPRGGGYLQKLHVQLTSMSWSIEELLLKLQYPPQLPQAPSAAGRSRPPPCHQLRKPGTAFESMSRAPKPSLLLRWRPWWSCLMR